jgi:hypothetical protein
MRYILFLLIILVGSSASAFELDFTPTPVDLTPVVAYDMTPVQPINFDMTPKAPEKPKTQYKVQAQTNVRYVYNSRGVFGRFRR